MATEDEIKKKLYQQMAQSSAAQQQEQLEQAVADVMARILDRKARERLNNLKVIKPDLALQLQVYLTQLYRAGEIKGIITDEQMVVILKNIGKQKEFVIKRK